MLNLNNMVAQKSAALGACASFSAQEQSPPRPTLASSIDFIEALNNRLNEINGSLTQMAIQLGGSFPVDTVKKEERPCNTLIERLRGCISNSHLRASQIEAAVMSLRVAFGVGE